MSAPTPFARLGYLHKQGSDLFSTGNQWADIGMDVAAGTNPWTGVPYYGAKAVDDFKNGKILSGLGNTLWGGLSFVGGAAVGKGALGLGSKLLGKGGAGAMARFGNTARQAFNTAAAGNGMTGMAARGAQNYSKMIQSGQNFAGRQLDNMGSRIANWQRPTLRQGMQPLGQAGGRAAATAGVSTAGALIAPANATAASAAAKVPAVTPVSPNAPAWYTAVTGNTAIPNFDGGFNPYAR